MNGVWAVLVGAGRGERLGLDRPKAFASLGGRPLLAESLARLEHCSQIDGIVVVAPDEWEEPAILLTEELSAGKVSACVTGGATRADSVRIGVAEIPDEVEAILVHDVARPLVSDEVVARVLEPLAEGWDGAVPGLAVADTVKRTDASGAITETVEREGLWTVQTPQAFKASALRRALEGPLRDASDCARFVEAMGGRVRVVPGDARLVKVTSPADLEAVESLLRA